MTTDPESQRLAELTQSTKERVYNDQVPLLLNYLRGIKAIASSNPEIPMPRWKRTLYRWQYKIEKIIEIIKE